MKLVAVALLSLSVMGSGCGYELRPDPFPAAIEHRYPSAELLTGGSTWNGLAIAAVEPGQPLINVRARIQGYYEGDVRITSDNCGADMTRQYKDSETIRIPLPQELTQICIVTATINPRYPKPGTQAIPIQGFRGYLSLVPKTTDKFLTDTHKVPAGPEWRRKLKVFYGVQSTVRGVFSGCGISSDHQYELNTNGWLEIELHDLVEEDVEVCTLSGILVHPTFKNVGVAVLMAQYDPRFTPLAVPTQEFDDEDLDILGTPEVAVSSWNSTSASDFSVDNELTIPDYKKQQGLRVRMLTVGGRSVFGSMTPNGMVWSQ